MPQFYIIWFNIITIQKIIIIVYYDFNCFFYSDNTFINVWLVQRAFFYDNTAFHKSDLFLLADVPIFDGYP